MVDHPALTTFSVLVSYISIFHLPFSHRGHVRSSRYDDAAFLMEKNAINVDLIISRVNFGKSKRETT